MSTVLVTGGAGFVGAYVSRALLQAGHRVVVYDARPGRNVLDLLLGEAPDSSLTVVGGEIVDGWQLLRLCRAEQVEYIVHLASPLTQDVTANPNTGVRDICLGTQTIFEVAHQAAVRRVVWASSVAVFGSAAHYPPGPVADDAPHRPESVYGSCKSLCEGLARRAWEQDGLDSVGLRLTVVYGAGRLRGYMSYPSHWLRAAAAGEPVHVPHGGQPMNWQYVEEVSDSVLCALGSAVPGEGRAFNTWGDTRTWAQAAEVVGRLRPGLPVTVEPGADPVISDAAHEFDAGPFRTRFGYRPSWPLERGVEATLATYAAIDAAGRTDAA
jgi:nucleoside-diphosphate-sugar epimerase